MHHNILKTLREEKKHLHHWKHLVFWTVFNGKPVQEKSPVSYVWAIYWKFNEREKQTSVNKQLIFQNYRRGRETAEEGLRLLNCRSKVCKRDRAGVTNYRYAEGDSHVCMSKVTWFRCMEYSHTWTGANFLWALVFIAKKKTSVTKTAVAVQFEAWTKYLLWPLLTSSAA